MVLTLAFMCVFLAASSYRLEGVTEAFYTHVACAVAGLVMYGVLGNRGTRFGRVFSGFAGGLLAVAAAAFSDPLAGCAAASAVIGALITRDAS